jgi:glycosyltransferase involved in cell wall biosynthesis
MRTLDVFVLPSLLEGISNTILEAMATGLPIVASSVGGNVELVDEGQTGQFISPRDLQGLARLLNEYVMNPSMRKTQGCYSRQVAEEKFGLSTMIRKYQDVYERLCRNGRDVRG